MLSRWFRRTVGKRPEEPWSLSAPLLHWSRDDVWTLRDALQGCLVLGATGSGKTSGSARAIAECFLRHGFGGLVLTAKTDERAAWQKLARCTGRESDLVVFGPGGDLRFNFLDEELKRGGAGSGLTENVLRLLSAVLEVAERGASSGGGREDEGYWRRAQRQLTRNVIDLLSMATGRVSVPDIYRVVISAPASRDQVRSQDWRSSSFCMWCLTEADKRGKTPMQQADLEVVADYFLVEYPALSEKTRSVIVSTLTSMIDVLNRGILRELFCKDTNIAPDAVEHGKVIIVDLPIKEYAEVGQFAQVLWKYAFQRSIERRDVSGSSRPVFLFADEAQHVITSYDMQFQTTCRSARVATVLLTQNVSNVYAALGGNEKGRSEAASLFGNLTTKVFHANGDPVTNEWASSLIGRTRQWFANGSSSRSAEDQLFDVGVLGQSINTSSGFSESYEHELQPSVFTGLRTGGPENDRWVDAVVFQSGRRFTSTGRVWMPVTFRQEASGS